MQPQDFLRYLRAEPFRPFRIQMTSGRTFEIRHPEMVRVGQRALLIFTFVSDDPSVFDDWDTVSLLLIERAEHLDAAAASWRKPTGFSNWGYGAMRIFVLGNGRRPGVTEDLETLRPFLLEHCTIAVEDL